MRSKQTEHSSKGTSHPSPHNILIMWAAFFRSLWSSLFSFVRLHCRYLFAWNRPVRRSLVMKPAPNPPLENSVPIWYRSLLAAFVSPSCTNHGFLPGMSHLLSVCGTEQALCARWYITIDQPISTRLHEPPGGLIEPSMSYRNVSVLKKAACGRRACEGVTGHAVCFAVNHSLVVICLLYTTMSLSRQQKYNGYEPPTKSHSLSLTHKIFKLFSKK